MGPPTISPNMNQMNVPNQHMMNIQSVFPRNNTFARISVIPSVVNMNPPNFISMQPISINQYNTTNNTNLTLNKTPIIANNYAVINNSSSGIKQETQAAAKPITCRQPRSVNTSEQKYKCPDCDKQYKHLCNLKSHQKVHTDEALICPHCKKSLDERQILKNIYVFILV